MTLTINIFLLLFGAIQSLLLSLWVFKQSRRNLSALYLAILLVVIALQLTLKAITKIWLIEHVRLFYLISYKIPYLMGPLIYLYAKSQQDPRFRFAHLFHFVPFIILSSLVILLNGLFLNVVTEGLIQALSLTIYAAIALCIIPKRLKIFIASVAIAEYTVIATLVLSFTMMDSFPDVRLAFAVLTVLVYWITYRTLSGEFSFAVDDGKGLPILKSIKYVNSTLKPDEAGRMELNLQQLMSVDKIYREPELTIDALAARLNVSRHHLSQVLNEKIGRSYAEYVNDLRLQEVMTRLRDPANNYLTIAAIAFDSGFNSMSTFNALFKKHTKTTPSKFRDSTPSA